MKTLYILFLLFLAVISSPIVWGQNGLQGPFVPIGIETVHTNGSTSDVQMLYKATTTGGQDIYAHGVHSMDEAQIKEQAASRADDPTAYKFNERVQDDGWNYHPPFVAPAGAAGDFVKDVEEPEEYDKVGECNSPANNISLSECIDLTIEDAQTCDEVNYLTTLCFDYESVECLPEGGNAVNIRMTLYPPFGAESSVIRGVWTAPPDFTLCSDAPGEFLPDPQPPIPEPGDFQEYMSGNPSPDPNPFAPDPKSPDYPPPMMDPDFYRAPSSQFFDMQLPSSPTPQQMSDQMTADYAGFTSTTAPLAAPLPGGMSFTPPPAGGSGDYDSPLSGYEVTGGSVGGGSSGSGSGSGGEGGDTEITVNVDVPDICETNPNSLACVDTNVGDEIVPDITVPSFDAGVGFSPVSLSNISGCPSPVSIDFLGDSFDIEYTIICDFGSSVSPLMLLFSSISAAMIMLGIRRTG